MILMNHMSDGPFERRVKVSHFELANPVKGLRSARTRITKTLQDLESIKQHRQEQPTLGGNPTKVQLRPLRRHRNLPDELLV